VPLPCLSTVIRGSNELKNFGVTEESKCVAWCQNVSHLFHFPICQLFCIFRVFKTFCVTVSHCITVWNIHGCHYCDTRHNCHKYQYHVTLVIKCVKGGVLVTDFNKVLGGGLKSDSKAFGDYFVVSQGKKTRARIYNASTLVNGTYGWKKSVIVQCSVHNTISVVQIWV
jgi:hypothetical protein